MEVGKTISHYKITEKLGEGGMGVVYKARDTKLDRTVALKFLPHHLTQSKEDKQRFIREAKAAAALNHPNICTIYNVDKHEDNQFIIMEYIKGETLQEKIKEGDLTLEKVLDYAIRIADALSEAHQNNIIHRDIKPENIMVDAKGRLKVMDFGLAKLKHTHDITKTSSTVGTLGYMSPEQIQGKQVDHRSDLFSLGIVLYEMLTGFKPFQGEHQAAMTYSIVNEKPTPLDTYLPEVPDELTQIFDRLLTKEPEERIGSAAEVKQQLETIAGLTGEISKQFQRSEAEREVTEKEDGSESTTFRITVPNFGFGDKSMGKVGLLAGAAGILALVLLIGWWFVDWNAVEHNTAAIPDDKKSEIANHSIAVLPFEVTGSGAEEWKDGMVTALSLNLDGAAGLRAIPDRTILAKWKQKGRADDIETKEALDIAREVGARYAIVGSAVQLGQDLRFGVDVREVASGQRLGQVEVRGAPDSVTVLTNNLTKEILGVLLERSDEAIPSVDLESITTESLPAFKAFLQGERHFRSGEYQAAIDNYESAVEMDSTFAIAYARLNPARYWAGDEAGDPEKASQRAYEESDQLPRRERRITRARHLWYNQDRDLAAADSFRQLSNEYPDDPSVWFLLGEVLWHGSIPRGWPEAEEAFQEAVQLDPGFTQYHHHLVDLAISFHHDSTLAAQRIATHPKGDYKQMYQLSLDLVFGSAGQRRKALGRLDSIAPSTIAELIFTLWHPVDGALEEKVIRKLIEEDIKSGVWFTRRLAENSLKRGKIEDMMSILQKEEIDQTVTNYYLALSLSFGYSVPDTLQRSNLELTKLGKEASLSRFFLTGIHLITEESDDNFDALMGRLRERVERANGQDTLGVQELMNELQGYRAWKEGDTEQAEYFWSKSKLGRLPWNAIWRGDLYRKVDKLEKAEGWYVAAWRLPEAQERLGMLYEEMNNPEKAADAYRRFIAAWKDADPELQDRVEQARQRLKQLTVSETGTPEEVIDVEE